MKHNKFVDNLVLWIVFGFLFLPIFVLILFSFNTSSLNIVFEVLYGLSQGKKVKELTSKKIKKTKIYEFKKHYFYLEEFFNFLENVNTEWREHFDGILSKQWL